MFKKQFIVLFTFYISYSWFTTFSKSILPAYFLENHLSFQQIIFGTILAFTGQLTALIFIKKLKSKLSWRLALVAWIVYLILIISVQSVYKFYLASFINGTSIFFFFIFYNIAHFENTPQENRGNSTAILFAVPSLVGIVGPLLAGYLAQINIYFLWLTSSLFFLVSFSLVSFQKNFEVKTDIKASINELKATRIFIFLEAVWEAMIFGVIPVYTLFFIKAPLQYGIFLAYLGVVSIIANLTLGNITDRLQKRAIFLYPLTIIMGIVTLSFLFVNGNITTWLILAGLIQFLLPLFWNLTAAMVIDSHSNLKLAIPGREFILAIGRIAGMLAVFISFSIEKTPYLLFLFLGGVILLFPILLVWNTKITKKHSYL